MVVAGELWPEEADEGLGSGYGLAVQDYAQLVSCACANIYRDDRSSCSGSHSARVLRSVMEPEPVFLAGAGAGEKAPAPGCCCLA